MTDIKVFNRWETTGIAVADEGLKGYITITPRIVPKTGARYAGKRFYKSKTFIVERLINKIMVPGHRSKKHTRTSYHTTGKATMAMALVEKAFIIIEQKLHKNPVEVFVKALENAAPREEIVTIEYGGARYPKSVECAPQRRVDVALRLMTEGSYQKSFNSKKPYEQILADEIINAFQCSANSTAVAKKLEMERQADSSR